VAIEGRSVLEEDVMSRDRFRKSATLASLVVQLLLLGAIRAGGQQATATLSGTVKDPSEAVIVGTKVTLTNTGTNISRSTTSNGEGIYLFTLVAPGTYEVSAEHPGFRKFV
jgi:hypothetical protein